jgi:dihydrodipicolinate synthase/N-acetylneuraminate lyase
MKTKKQLNGIVPVMVTPMLQDGSPDPEGIHSLVEFLIEKGVGGLWVLGSASEDINMTLEQRIQVVRFTAEANKGRIPLIVGSGLTAFGDLLKFFDVVRDLDLSGLHVLPYDLKLGESRLIHFFLELAQRSPFPIWLYHNPKRGRPITLKIISEVRDHPHIAGIKVGGYNLGEMTGAIMLKNKDFEVIGAGGGQLFQMLCLGAEAHTTSEGCCYPEAFIEIMKDYGDGNITRAREKQFSLIRLSKSFPRTDNGEYAAEEKYILSKRGVCREHVVPIYRTLSKEEKYAIDQALKEFGFEWA